MRKTIIATIVSLATLAGPVAAQAQVATQFGIPEGTGTGTTERFSPAPSASPSLGSSGGAMTLSHTHVGVHHAVRARR